MKEEILRMDRVTLVEQGVTELKHFSLEVNAGEIVGLIPVNDTGLDALMRLLTQNLPLHYGFVHYRGKLINDWRHERPHLNSIGMIANRSGLAGDLTVAENVFVLRHGFRKHIIRHQVLARQLQPFLDEIGVHLSADAYARDLSAFHRFVAEIVRSVVAGYRLIVLQEPGTVVGDARLSQLHRILRHYAEKGIAFLYVSLHYEEVRQCCDRVAMMVDGQIPKVLLPKDTSATFPPCYGVEAFTSLVSARVNRPSPGPESALEMRGVRYRAVRRLTLTVKTGECVVLQDLNNRIFEDLLSLLTGDALPEAGQITSGGQPLGRRTRDVAVISALPAETMIFPDMSYLDNLCFTLDGRLPGIWRKPRLLRSVRREYGPLLGEEAFGLPVDALSKRQKYDLVYTRVLLARPRLVVCVQPFMQADVEARMHIWSLMNRLLDKGCAVLVLAVNLADSLSMADRLIRVRDGVTEADLPRERFGELPLNTPWHDLWQRAPEG